MSVATHGRNCFQSVTPRISIRGMVEADRDKSERGIEAVRATGADSDSAAASDGVEIWARRLGRVLGWSAAALMLIYLLRTYAS